MGSNQREVVAISSLCKSLAAGISIRENNFHLFAQQFSTPNVVGEIKLENTNLGNGGLLVGDVSQINIVSSLVELVRRVGSSFLGQADQLCSAAGRLDELFQPEESVSRSGVLVEGRRAIVGAVDRELLRRKGRVVVEPVD
jgi:hypothetical protein